ncbi:hypothetical protein R1sor_004001 [Riccia sorocarpa]|uniref:SGS domain-containing protein n=1 Tax=Riccia sorocarpa TaxID=122646 RepID=A0ABD3H620_9MARC
MQFNYANGTENHYMDGPISGLFAVINMDEERVRNEPAVKYPSSNKKGARDWDRLEAEVKKEENDKKLEDDAALNTLFQDIYKNVNEDFRRAMRNHSSVESNDTVLSTNWKEVRSKEVRSKEMEKSPRRVWSLKNGGGGGECSQDSNLVSCNWESNNFFS